mgnify:CR=1 FL=1
MDRLEQVPEHIKALMAKHGVNCDIVEFAVSADLSEDGYFSEVWLAVTKEKIHVLKLGDREEDVSGIIKGKRPKRKESKKRYDDAEVIREELALKDIDDIKVENLISTGTLTATISGEDRIVCCFTNTHLRKFTIFVKLVKKLKKGEELTEEDFKDDRAEQFCPKCGRRYPDPSKKICPKCLNKRKLFLRILSFAPKYKGQIALIFTCMIASTLMKLASPYIGGKVLYDEVFDKGSKYYGKVGQVVLLTVALEVVSLLIQIAYGRLNAGVAAGLVYDIKLGVFTALQKLSLRFFSSRQTGSLMNRVNGDANHIQYFINDGMPFFIVNSISIIGIATIMFSINWKLALLVFIPVPVIVVMTKVLFPKIDTLYSRVFRRNSSMLSLINDTLTGARVVKAFGKESSEVERFNAANKSVYSVNVDVGNMSSTVFPMFGYVMGLGSLIVWGVGGWQVVKGELSFGTLMTFQLYLGMIYGPLQFMTNIVDWWTSSMNSAQRIFEIIDAVPEITNAPNPVRMPFIKGDVALKNVTFSYETNKPVLHDVSLEVKAGEMIGLVGHSGAGKSTITNLITRLYDVEEGSIEIDGVNIKNIAIEDLRPQIGMVLQETYLFTGTIAENIAYAKPDATMSDIIRAAKAANAHDFIIRLPDGYDTVIGKRRNNLSGGEKQRISIARAILHDPRILILDEATASLDTETERLIQEALERLVKGRTTFAIAHRLSTLRNADRIVVIERGRVAEIGTHSELVALKGIYYNMLQRQKEALKIKGVE